MGLKVNLRDKRFGRKIIFKDLSLDFPDTGLYVLAGVSGRGKTTLLRMISGLDTDFSGCIIGGGAKNVSYHFQEYRLFENLSALENITELSFNNEDKEDITLATDTLKALGFTDEDIHLRPSELSGGMKIRVSFARAVLKNAPVLLLDEPTKELDREAASSVCRMINDKAKNALVILVTHETELTFLDNPVIIKI